MIYYLFTLSLRKNKYFPNLNSNAFSCCDKTALEMRLIYLVDFIKAKWKNLYDGFKKCLDRQREATRSGAGYVKPPTCRFYNELTFLRNVITNRKTLSNVTIELESPAEISQATITNQSPAENINNLSPTSSCSNLALDDTQPAYVTATTTHIATPRLGAQKSKSSKKRSSLEVDPGLSLNKLGRVL